MRTHCWGNKYIYILVYTLKYSSRDACAQNYFSALINHHIPQFKDGKVHSNAHNCGGDLPARLLAPRDPPRVTQSASVTLPTLDLDA